LEKEKEGDTKKRQKKTHSEK